MATKVKLSPDKIAEKWGRRTKAAVSDITAGIDRVTESPGQKAIAKKDKMKANLIKSIDDGTWAARLGDVSLDDWKAKTKTKVTERLAGGVDGAAAKRLKFDTHNVAVINEILPKIDAMPDMVLEDSVNRVRTFMDHMAKNKYKKA